jgi:hypothetical protein
LERSTSGPIRLINDKTSCPAKTRLSLESEVAAWRNYSNVITTAGKNKI